MNITDLLKDDVAVNKLLDTNSNIVCNDNTIEALLIASSFNKSPKKVVVVKNNLYSASKLYERLLGLVDNTKLFLFPSDESFELESISQNDEFIYQRINTLNSIKDLDSYLIIAHTSSLIRYLPSPSIFYNSCINLSLNQTFSMDQLVNILLDSGYEKQEFINAPLQFSKRGGVIDIYSINNINPIRIEFFDDEIDSIREFDISTKRTLKTLNCTKIISGTDLIFDHHNIDNLTNLKDLNIKSLDTDIELLKLNPTYHLIYKYYPYLVNKTSSLLDYLDDYKIVISNRDDIVNNFNFIVKETHDYFINNANYEFKLYNNIFDVLFTKSNISYINKFAKSPKDINFNVLEVDSSNGNFKVLLTLIKSYLLSNYALVLCLDNKAQYDCLTSFLKEEHLNIEELEDDLVSSHIYFSHIYLKEGFEISDKKIIFLSSYELFGVKDKINISQNKYKYSEEISSLDALKENDYVVHDSYGIGKYTGIINILVDDIHKDYIHIEYANNASVDIPVEYFKSIRKYCGRDGVIPKLSKLGSKEWTNTKNKIKNRIKELTSKIMNNYMARTKDIGFAFAKDDELQLEFENAFPYVLTSDQEKSLNEIKHDMELPYPMDRVLCGDVGFGKTEVALRAAFKAINNYKQVAILCPTTILASQHYKTCLKRFENFNIRIKMVSRLVNNKELKEIINDVNNGNVELLIGTHKLLNKDIKFKDLGLLIIDEEQRFGVEHKEKIKELKQGVDVLTLSATPIPRTLQSSLVGIRALSQIETPINNRVSVQTYVLEKNYNLIKEIIQRELGRLGQVYFIHNNIDSINEVETKLHSLVPSAKIGIIHGRMEKDKIEDVMFKFINNELDILLSTTIVENGIDIANANTMIIDNADTFGLSQLYQLKGRVGRSEKIGYCYLFYNPLKELSDIAAKRLNAIKEFSKLGSGYKIALRDLTIRGAGDLLGKEQAGFIDSVGIDLYLNLLEESIEEAKNGIKKEENIIHKNVPVDAYIPDDFSSTNNNKIDLYKKITTITNLSDLDKMKEELDDIYGKIPENVELLLEKRKLELYIPLDIIEDIKEEDDKYGVVLSPLVSYIEGIGEKLFDIVNSVDKQIYLSSYNNRITIKTYKSNPNWLFKLNKILSKIKDLVDKKM